jgi:hypothetical protein
MKFIQIVSLLSALAFTAPAAAQTTEVNEQFRHHSVNWSGPSTGAMLVRWRPVIVDGKIAICGAYANRGGSTFVRLGRQAIRNMWIDRNGTAFMRNLHFFAVDGSEAYTRGLIGERATCRVTNTPGTADSLSEFTFGYRAGRYRLD